MTTPALSSGQEILCRDVTYNTMVVKIVSHQPYKLLSCIASPENICENK